MAEEDQRIRRPRPADGEYVTVLGIQEAMEYARVDVGNTDRLREIVREHGWPGRSLVGDEAARAAWLLAQHADRQLDFQREALPLLERAVAAGEAEQAHGPICGAAWNVLMSDVRSFGVMEHVDEARRQRTVVARSGDEA
jgi:hypothetical protein